MSDFDNSIPVKTQNAGDVVVKVGDGTTPSQQLAVEVDGSINVNVANITLDKADDSIATETVEQSTRIDEVSSALLYLGYAAIGASEASALWKIKRLTITGSVTKIEYADSNASYDNIWANRSSLTYG